jgi:GTP cyclohydrolase I
MSPALSRLLVLLQLAAWTAGTPRPAPQPQPADVADLCAPAAATKLGPSATEEERRAAIEGAMRTILLAIGEDPDREGIVKTPARVAKAMLDNTAGYDHRGTTVDTIVNGAMFNESHREMVVVHGIEIFSMCEHHMLPFFGTVDIGYIPDGRVIGLSKLARIADHFARRLQVQERLTTQIAQSLANATGAAGVMVLVEARHMCMAMRGAKQTHAETVTTSTTGVFADALGGSNLRQEFLRLVGR